MSKKIFTWVGHPAEQSLSHGLMEAFEEGATKAGAEIRRMNVHDMDYNPNLANGYKQRQDHEPALRQWQENLLWCDHTCWAYPMWWASMPAKMKGAVDRAMLPGFGFAYHENGPLWDKLLKGRSASVIMTADTPSFFDRLTAAAPARKQIRIKTFEFVGIKPVKTHYFAPVKTAKPAKIDAWKKRLRDAGEKAGR